MVGEVENETPSAGSDGENREGTENLGGSGADVTYGPAQDAARCDRGAVAASGRDDATAGVYCLKKIQKRPPRRASK